MLLAEEPVFIKAPSRAELVNREGVKYTAFRASLRPKYGLVWTHIALGYVTLVVVLLGCGWLQLQGAPWWLIVPVGALLTGYLLAYIHLFIHEAAHYNLAPVRKTNDRLANLFIGLIVGVDISSYRPIHFDHHRHLGTTRDPERTYFDSLTWGFIVESLLGIRVLKVISARKDNNGGHCLNDGVKAAAAGRTMLVFGSLVNLGLLSLLWAGGFCQVMLVWLGGIGAVFPFFTAIRQLLEHRGEHALASVNYAEVDHGAVTRMFGDGPLAGTLGGAGFNRHLLHHWDPQLSYTRLKEAEVFLLDTAFGPPIREMRATYLLAFRKLFNR